MSCPACPGGSRKIRRIHVERKDIDCVYDENVAIDEILFDLEAHYGKGRLVRVGNKLRYSSLPPEKMPA